MLQVYRTADFSCDGKGLLMIIEIDFNSDEAIYQQLCNQIILEIATSHLREGDSLPSVRALSGELRISALTVKKAYDRLEEEGYTRTIHGKGTFVAQEDPALMAEQHRREIEAQMGALVARARVYGLKREELEQILGGTKHGRT